jgi:hypothetical protein
MREFSLVVFDLRLGSGLMCLIPCLKLAMHLSWRDLRPANDFMHMGNFEAA